MVPFFPLERIYEPVEIIRYKSKYLTLIEAMIVHLMGKFNFMDSHKIIDLWLKGGNYLVDYLVSLE